MTDPNIKLAIDYLQDLFEKLDNRLIDPALADWVFAREAWRVVQEKLQAQAEEIEQLRGARDRLSEEIAIEQQEAGALYEQMAKLTEERDRLRGEIERPQPVPQWLLDQYGVRLKPCPFCGVADKAWLLCFGASSAELDMRYFVQCEQCDARGPVTLYSQEAVAGWNRVQKELEGLPGTGEGG